MSARARVADTTREAITTMVMQLTGGFMGMFDECRSSDNSVFVQPSTLYPYTPVSVHCFQSLQFPVSLPLRMYMRRTFTMAVWPGAGSQFSV